MALLLQPRAADGTSWDAFRSDCRSGTPSLTGVGASPGNGGDRLPLREAQDGLCVGFVDDEHIDDACAEDAQDGVRLLRLAGHRHDGADGAQVVDGERDEAAAVRGVDERARSAT